MAELRNFDAEMLPSLKDDGMHLRSQPDLAEVKSQDTQNPAAGDSQEHLRANDDEAGVLTGAAASGGDTANLAVNGVPTDPGDTHGGRAREAGPAGAASKGQPGVLSATVEMKYLLLPMVSSSMHQSSCQPGPAQPDCGVGKVSYLPRAEIGCCRHGYH